MRTATDCIENILKLLMSKPGTDAIYYVVIRKMEQRWEHIA